MKVSERGIFHGNEIEKFPNSLSYKGFYCSFMTEWE